MHIVAAAACDSFSHFDAAFHMSQLRAPPGNAPLLRHAASIRQQLHRHGRQGRQSRSRIGPATSVIFQADAIGPTGAHRPAAPLPSRCLPIIARMLVARLVAHVLNCPCRPVAMHTRLPLNQAGRMFQTPIYLVAQA